MRDIHEQHDTKRGRTLVRVLRILRRLENGERLAMQDLAEEHSCNLRTIRRDLYALEEAGVVLAHDRDGNERGHWWLLYRREQAS